MGELGDPEVIAQVARTAATALSALALPRPAIDLGCKFEVGQVRALAIRLEANLKKCLYLTDPAAPYVIEWFEAEHLGVLIRAQASRDATPEDADGRTHISGPCRHATEDEVSAALGVRS